MGKKRDGKGKKVSRRVVLGMMAASAAALCTGCPSTGGGRPGRKLIILGFDGMDYSLTGEMLGRGELPNFRKVADRGAFLPLVTSTPPQSPVAWSNFITGKNPGGHGIFDFIARDPETYLPEFSLSRVSGSEQYVTLGNYKIPVKSGKVELLRKGRSWWNILEENGVPATVLNVPSNFPPEETGQRCVTGMGTPDMLGTYGTFSFYTTEPQEDGRVQGGKIYHVDVFDDTVEAEILGPENTFLKDKPNAVAGFKVFLDKEGRQAKLSLQGQEIILKEGEWSGWLKVGFRLAPLVEVGGIVRAHLKSVEPEFRLYVSPVNIDPADPYLPVSTPKDYSAEIARELGPFYTQGIPEDTWALNEGRLDEDEFLVQAGLVKNERTALFKLEFERFRKGGQGVYFCYFGLTDTGSHMFWGHRDPRHPVYDPAYSPKYSKAVEGFYKEMDGVVGHALEGMPEDADLIILSDHGFSPFYRAFHLNRWLCDSGYLALLDRERGESAEFFENVEWSETRAYALGLNGLYLNLAGREGQGTVGEGEKAALVEELVGRLGEVVDPATGERVIHKAYDSSKIYTGAYKGLAPDIVIGYNAGYRSSWETALGKVPKDLLGDNRKKWSGDHCMDPAFVPGIFFSSRRTETGSVRLEDFAPSILSLFGIKAPEDMDGRSLF